MTSCRLKPGVFALAILCSAVVETQLGGKGGGNARLTEFGKGLIETYRAIEMDAGRNFALRIQQLEERLAREQNDTEALPRLP